MTVYPSDTPATRSALAVLGLRPEVIAAWLRCEGSGPGRNNPLNARGPVLPGNSGFDAQGFASFPDLATAAQAYLWRLEHVAGAGYGAILASRGGSALEQAQAIQASSWAAGHYGMTTNPPGCLVRNLPDVPATPTEAPMALQFVFLGMAGTAKVVEAGHQLFRIDDPSIRRTLIVGESHAAARITLTAPLDLHGGDRTSAVLFVGTGPAEAALLCDVSFAVDASAQALQAKIDAAKEALA